MPAMLSPASPRPRDEPLSLSPYRVALTACAIVGALMLNRLGLFGSIAFFMLLAGMMVWKPESAFQAMMLGFLGLVANVAFVPKTSIWTLARFVILAVALLRFSIDLNAMRRSLFSERYYLGLSLFVLTAALTSIASGYFVHIALFKLLSFAIGTSAVLSGVAVLRARRADLTEWCVSFAAAVMCLGVLSIVMGVGYNYKTLSKATTSTIFNGPFYHPNTTGPLLALLLIYLASVYLFAPYKNRWVAVVTGAVLLFLLVKTQSRTGLASFLAGLSVIGACYAFLARRGAVALRVNATTLAITVRLAVAVLLTVATVSYLSGGFQKALVSYVNKTMRSEEFDLDVALSSRRGQVMAIYDNFTQSPMVGIGFEVALGEGFAQSATLFSAPIEKCFLPVAVLEETGIIGTTSFVIFLGSFFLAMYRTLNAPAIAMMATFLFVNFGEVMFFSPAGHGGFAWLMVGIGIILGDRCVFLHRRSLDPANSSLRSAISADGSRAIALNFRLS